MKALLCGTILALFFLSCSPNANDHDCCPTLAPGVYHHEEISIQPASGGAEPETTSLYGSDTLRSDGSFQLTAMQTIPGIGWNKQPVFEEKGKWKHSGDSLILTEVQERGWNPTAGSMGAWSQSGSGRIGSRVRNVQAGSYEEYDAELDAWMLWQAAR